MTGEKTTKVNEMEIRVNFERNNVSIKVQNMEFVLSIPELNEIDEFVMNELESYQRQKTKSVKLDPEKIKKTNELFRGEPAK